LILCYDFCSHHFSQILGFEISFSIAFQFTESFISTSDLDFNPHFTLWFSIYQVLILDGDRVTNFCCYCYCRTFRELSF
jgi:hypothetical protein